MNWFIDQPDMLQDELKRLVAIGAKYEIDEEAQSKQQIILNVTFCIEDDKLDFVCKYPSEYPYFPPEITCENFPPGRHLEPTGKSLCTFADKNNKWDISNDTLAGLLENQITEIYKIHKDPEPISEFEDELEGYQPSGQLHAELNSSITVTFDKELLASIGRGYIQIIPIKDGKKDSIRGCLSLIFDNEGKVSIKDETEFSQRFTFKIPIRWCKLSQPLTSVNYEGIYKQVISDFPEMEKDSFVKVGRIEVEIIGVCFEEESNRDHLESNWLFLIKRKWKEKKCLVGKNSIIRSDHLHPNQSLARTPNLIGLDGKTVTIIGLGALGSQVAFQLARAGVKNFNFIDKDYLQIGNLQRWLPGLPYIGLSKVQAVSQIICNGYLGLNARAYNFEIGGTQKLQLDTKKEVLMSEFLRDEIIQKSDLVIDCSAMLNVNQYLSYLCKSSQIDYIWCSATNGAWGGIVGRSPASYTKDVWMKFNDQYGRKTIPEVSFEPSEFVQPKGCFHPTFTGTGFDLDTVSNMASRLAISMLQSNRYGQFDDDVFIVEQFKNGVPITPSWRSYSYKDE